MTTQRGAFIVFEGIDCSGKTTQSLRLVKNLNLDNIATCHMRFPDRTTEIGKICGAYLQNAKQIEDHTIHLLFSANRWEAKNIIMRLINEGTTIIADRYAYSGVAYTTAKGYDLDWCKGPDKGLPIPDMVIYLKLSVEEASKRGNYGEERYENKEFQTNVANVFETLRERNWRMIDAQRPPEEISDHIRALVNDALETAKETPLQYSLWV